MLDREKKGPAIEMIRRSLANYGRTPDFLKSNLNSTLEGLANYINSDATLNEVQAFMLVGYLESCESNNVRQVKKEVEEFDRTGEKPDGPAKFLEYHRSLMSLARFINTCH